MVHVNSMFLTGFGLSCGVELVNSEVSVNLLELDFLSSFPALFFCLEFHFFNAVADLSNAL